MALRQTARIAFAGRFVVPSFVAFVATRAVRLDVRVVIEAASAGRFVVDVSGQPDLVDAFEMACSLGPLDCLVLDCRRETMEGGRP